MINDQYKCIFMHITKTGGSSIEEVFDYRGIKHHRPEEMIENIGQEKWDNYFKFTFVRNPWDRLVSEYFYRIKKGSTSVNFKSWLVEMRGFDSWAGGLQSKWMQERNFDFVGRFENFQNDFDQICQKINHPKVLLPHANSTTHQHYSAYYDEESKDLVRNWHKADIELFDYDFCKT